MWKWSLTTSFHSCLLFQSPLQHWAERKTLSKANIKGITTLRQKLRRYVKEQFESEITAYRESPDPEGYTSTEQADDDEGEESEGTFCLL